MRGFRNASGGLCVGSGGGTESGASDWRLLRWAPDGVLSLSLSHSLLYFLLDSQDPGELPPRLGYVSLWLVGASPRLQGLVIPLSWADVPAPSGH